VPPRVSTVTPLVKKNLSHGFFVGFVPLSSLAGCRVEKSYLKIYCGFFYKKPPCLGGARPAHPWSA